MQFENVNHIHVVSKNFEKTSSIFERIIGRKPDFSGDFTETQGTKVSYWNFPTGIQVIGVSGEHPLAAFLGETEAGVQTVSVQVRSVDDHIDELDAMGYPMVIDLVAGGGVRETNFNTWEDLGFNLELMEYVASFRE